MDDLSIQPEENPGAFYPPAESPRVEIDYDTSSDPDGSDSDSDGDESIKSTRSFSYQNLLQIEENGRRYCNENYFMPNDETELTRLNIIHQIYLILQEGRLTLAPVPAHAPRILDIGTGPGDWAIEMSAEYPNATIIASDLGVFDSGLGHVSIPNVDFQLADAQSEWTYHEPFDLIHIRGLSGAFTDWPAVYRQALTHLKPGGYIEVADTDPAGDTITIEEKGSSSSSDGSTPHLHTYSSALRAAGHESGYPRDLHHLSKAVLTEAGFDDINIIEREFPIGLWPQDPRDKCIGKMALIALLEGLEAHALRPLTRSGYTPQTAQELCEKVQEEVLAAEKITARVRIVTGRKPSSYAQRRQDVMARAMAKIKILNEVADDDTD